MENKSTLKLLRENKNIISQVKWMRNGNKYSTMVKARSDPLDLEWRTRNPQVGKTCK